MRTPTIEIDLNKIAHNANLLRDVYGSKGISIIGVTKGVSSDIKFAQTLVHTGIEMLGDSNIDHLKRMKKAGIKAKFILLRTPAISEIELVVKYADISLNTEIKVIERLAEVAKKYQKVHKIILMIEMGDLREGILKEDILNFIENVMRFPNIEIVGIGTNFACFSEVPPLESEMQRLTTIAFEIERKFPLKLTYISGGNSANHYWLMNTKNTGRINNLRLGESILLGCESIKKETIPGLYTDAFKLVAEVIELKEKPKAANIDFSQKRVQAILNIGNQDTCISGLSPNVDIDIIGASSNHLVIDTKKTGLKVGDNVEFSPNYSAILASMTSPNVFKYYFGSGV